MAVTGAATRKLVRERDKLKKEENYNSDRLYLHVYDVRQPEKQNIWCRKIITWKRLALVVFFVQETVA